MNFMSFVYACMIVCMCVSIYVHVVFICLRAYMDCMHAQRHVHISHTHACTCTHTQNTQIDVYLSIHTHMHIHILYTHTSYFGVYNIF